MTSDLSGDDLTAAVLDSFAPSTEPRLREILQVVTSHLHAAVKELRLTQKELDAALQFLTAVGQKCDETRQEFILLSDVLGISMLVETLNDSDDAHATEATVLGPFHMTESPRRALGDAINLLPGGEPAYITGRVTDSDDNPIANAVIDVWQCNEEGFYDVQQPDVQPAGNGRGIFRTDADGQFRFRSIVPSHYPIPNDGPVGVLLDLTGRHPYRPAHVHFIAQADGYRELTTHMFVADSPYIDSDTVFAVRESLIVPFHPVTDADQAASVGLSSPYHHAIVNIVLATDEEEAAA
ncbi:hydroxyquinol 1,2-dioxygenase [Leifsonia kafniensis]|uniref:Hydroxyquinol 1,2-dioxygenase n=1 Tax=Leifsonia kafniensis TaxID=475957 RepID=A0ABP7KRR3_9MICO